MKELIKKMKNTDTWYREDIGELLAHNNYKIGDKQFFNQAIYQAQEAQLIKPISIPIQRNSAFTPGENLFTYNYQYKPDDIVNWIEKKHWKYPKELSNLTKEKKTSLSPHDKNTSEIMLESSDYWKKLKEMSIAAIFKYPKWQSGQKKLQQSTVTDLLKQNLKADSREAEIIKKILTDIFE